MTVTPKPCHDDTMSLEYAWSLTSSHKELSVPSFEPFLQLTMRHHPLSLAEAATLTSSSTTTTSRPCVKTELHGVIEHLSQLGLETPHQEGNQNQAGEKWNARSVVMNMSTPVGGSFVKQPSSSSSRKTFAMFTTPTAATPCYFGGTALDVNNANNNNNYPHLKRNHPSTPSTAQQYQQQDMDMLTTPSSRVTCKKSRSSLLLRNAPRLPDSPALSEEGVIHHPPMFSPFCRELSIRTRYLPAMALAEGSSSSSSTSGGEDDDDDVIQQQKGAAAAAAPPSRDSSSSSLHYRMHKQRLGSTSSTAPAPPPMPLIGSLEGAMMASPSYPSRTLKMRKVDRELIFLP